MRLYYLLLVVGLAAADCDSSIFAGCLSDLTTTLNVIDKPLLNSASAIQFRSEVEAYYELSNIVGLNQVCKAFRDFRMCMSPQYSSCMQASQFLDISDPYTVYIFLSTFNTMHFTCGGGFQTYLTNQNCMTQAWTGDSYTKLSSLRQTFEITTNSSTPVEACVFANNYLDGWSNQFKSICGTSSQDTQFWACEYARINMFTRFPNCANPCVLPYAGGIL